MKKYTLFVLAIATIIAVSGCSRFRVYKLNIQQGNVISHEKVEQVELGMSQEQVQYLLGTPLVNDTFSPLRWDYFWSLKDRNEVTTTKRLILTFDETGTLIDMQEQLEPVVQAAEE